MAAHWPADTLHPWLCHWWVAKIIPHDAPCAFLWIGGGGSETLQTLSCSGKTGHQVLHVECVHQEAPLGADRQESKSVTFVNPTWR